MNLKLIILSLVVIVSILATGCNSNKKEAKKDPHECIVTGTIEGYTGDKLYVAYPNGEKIVFDTLDYKNGRFHIKKSWEFPVMISMNLGPEGSLWDKAREDKVLLEFWCEIGTTDVKAKMSDLSNPVVTGCQFHTDYDQYNKDNLEFIKTNDWMTRYREIIAMDDIEPYRKELDSLCMVGYRKDEDWFHQYRKDHNDNLYVAVSIWSRMRKQDTGETIEDFKEMVNTISPKIADHPVVIETKRLLNEITSLKVGVNELVKDAPDISYKVDKSYAGEMHNKVSYLSVFPNNDLCVLKGSYKASVNTYTEAYQKRGKDYFKIEILSPQGKIKKTFSLDTKELPSVISVDDDNNIHVITCAITHKTIKQRGRKKKIYEISGVYCEVYNTEGIMLKRFKVDGINRPTGCQIYKDKLYISDTDNSIVGIYNKNTGENISNISHLRSCCAILDIDVDKEGKLFVANLGAFQVQGYDKEGKQILSFGKKGKDINSFSGCCNPVSLSRLDNNCLVTVEKTPTRIKVYGKNGAKTIAGIEELVKGCEHIPVTSDHRNNIYLASPEKGIVKCIPVS